MAVFADIYLQQASQPRSLSFDDAEQFLWPVHMWQVYTASPQGRQLNVFEKTMLQLFDVSGTRSVNNEQIAAWLGLDLDMVSYIVTAQLIPNGWLTEKGVVTKEGKRLLDEELTDNLTTAYIFQCAITGLWLPRICFSLNEIYPCNEGRNLKFKLNRATDRTRTPFIINAKHRESIAPEQRDLKKIESSYKEAVYIAKNTRDKAEWQDENSKVDTLDLGSAVGVPVYLTVWGDTTSSYEWTLYDPFNISTRSEWMQDLFQSVCKFNSGLGKFALSKLCTDNDDLNYEETCKQLEEAARLIVLVDYSGAEQVEGLTDILYQLMELNARITKIERTDYASNANLVVNCGQVIETVCSYLLRHYQLNDLFRLPKPRTKDGKDILKDLVINATLMNAPMVNEVLKVNASKVYSAAILKNSSVRAQLAAIFISMEAHHSHPLKFILDDEWLFKRLYQITHMRDDCAHGGSTKIDKKQVESMMATIDTFLQKLFIGIKNNG